MCRTRAFCRAVLPMLAALGLAALVSGCVAYPAYPGYGYYGPGYGYGYAPGGYVAIGGGWGGGWHGGGWGWHH
ncbi:MAG TPA: hypothetical protein VMU81_05925 [Acetobacteraceae bacterium]|jgi:hypothetical protein|nr:hypothetical protein [Acetobacteraceae bacterium]